MAERLPDLFQGVVVAFVIHSNDVVDHPRLLEEVSRQKGATGRLFKTVSAAERWLTSV